MEPQCPACSASLPGDGLSCPQCGGDLGWYIRKPDGQVYGPMDLRTLDRCINEARLVAGDEVRLSSTGDFVSAQERLGDRLTAPPPPAAVPLAYAGAAGAATGGASLAKGCGIGAVVCVGVVALLAALMFPVFTRARGKARQVSCASNLKQVSLGLMMYASDYDDRFPRDMDWQAATYPYVRNQAIYSCPECPNEQGYTHNPRLHTVETKTLQRSAQTLEWWDAGAQVSGLTAPPGTTSQRHNGGDNFGYADGHVKWSTTAAAAGAQLGPPPTTP